MERTLNEAAIAAGSEWSTIYANFADTKMKTSDKVISAKRFNSLRENIDMGVSTGIAEVSAGGPVKGSYFVTLTDKLNEWIGKI